MTVNLNSASDGAVAARCWQLEDNVEFARFSGDWNPMHVDPIAARRTQAGAPAVHGVHDFLWAMDQVARQGTDLSRYSTFKVQFSKFVLAGTETVMSVEEADKLRVEVRAGNSIVLIATAKQGEARLSDDPDLADVETSPVPAKPLDLAVTEMEGRKGWLVLPDPTGAERLFPALCEVWGTERVGAVALLSTVVGMACPGLHSIFAGFNLKLGAFSAGRGGLGFHCTRADERFRSVSVRCVANGLNADISAFARIPPVSMPGVGELKERVAFDLSGRRALVIGGSRGLGEATAKLFAAAGGRVVVTYAVGKEDAESVAETITSECGSDAARAIKYDALDDASAQLDCLTEAPTDIFYFATGRIGSGDGSAFDRATFAAYSDIYLSGFSDLCREAARRWPDTTIRILYPSTVFIDDRPAGMAEYAMVKAAGEILCEELSKAHPTLRISSPRLPRVLTDQTATVVHISTEDATEVMMKLLGDSADKPLADQRPLAPTSA